MKSHSGILHELKRTRATVYLIAAFYVAAGFFVSIPAALAGDRISTFLGFLIISVALGGTVMFIAVLNLARQIGKVAQTVHETAERMQQVAAQLEAGDRRDRNESNVRVVDLTSFGSGDCRSLVAASLDRSRFPRLVETMELDPPAESAPEDRSTSSNPAIRSRAAAADEPVGAKEADSDNDRPHDGTPSTEPIAPVATPVTTRNLMREWRLAVRRKDLTACRQLFRGLAETMDAQHVAALREQLQALTGRTEQALREEFSRCAATREYGRMLAVGDRIDELFPDSRMARDYQKLHRHIEERFAEQTRERTALRLIQ